MAMIIQNKNIINANMRGVFSYLNRNYKNYDWDEVEEDIRMGLTSIQDELCNATKALLLLKDQNKNNQKVCTAVNNFLKMLIRENSNIKVN